MNGNSVVMLTALNSEYEAVRERLTSLQMYRHSKGTRFECGTLAGTTCRIVLGLVGKGNHASAVLAERAIDEFSPLAVLFVGVAGGLWPSTALGDVVMATHIYAYHGGTSEEDGLKARPRVWEIPHGVHQIAHHLDRTRDWANHLPSDTTPPRVHFGAIAAGEIVHDSRVSYEAQWIRRHYNDALAIEMEAAGIAQAGHLSGSPVAVVRGISDHADGTKTASDEDNWQPRAATNAAAFATRLAEELINDAINDGEDPMRQESGIKTTGTTVNNFATGVVGTQAGQIIGSNVQVSMTSEASPPSNLVEELNALRDQLLRERSAGRLDETTYEAAQAELDVADKALREGTPEGTSTFMLALKRLRGLIADVAELMAKVGALIAAAKGLS